MGAITLPFHPQRTSVSFGEQKYLMSSDQLFNILLSLLFSGIALGLIYYQLLLNAAQRQELILYTLYCPTGVFHRCWFTP